MRPRLPRLRLGGRQALVFVGGAVLLLAGALTLAAGEFVRDRLIGPFLFLFQLAGLYLQAIPQFGLWAILLLLLLLFGLYSVHSLRLTGTQAQARHKGGRIPPTTAGLGPLAELAERIDLGARGEYFRWRLQRELRDLLVELLAWRRGLSPEEALRLVRSGEWPGPPEPWLREFFQAQGLGRHRLLFPWRWRRLRPQPQDQGQGQDQGRERKGERDFPEELAAAILYLERLAARPEGGDGGDGA
jgi:hypothetical protein